MKFNKVAQAFYAVDRLKSDSANYLFPFEYTHPRTQSRSCCWAVCNFENIFFLNQDTSASIYSKTILRDYLHTFVMHTTKLVLKYTAQLLYRDAFYIDDRSSQDLQLSPDSR